MNQAFNDFLSSVGGGLSGDGGPNMKNYQHASKLYVEGGYARAPKFNHLYFVAFNINDGVIRDPAWRENSYNTVGLLVKSTTLPKFKIANEAMNQYNRKTQVQTKLTYEPVTMEFHDDNSEITNGLWKNYYRYYYTDSIYGGKDDTVKPTPSQVSLGKKLFGGLLSPGSKRIKQRENNIFPNAYTDNKYMADTYPYGLDNFQSVPFFKSIDIFVLYQQKFTQITLINPKITSWDHDDVGQSDSTKLMRNKMSLVYENVLYNDGRIGKGSKSGIFAEAFYDTSPSPLSIAGKGSASLFGPGGLIGGFQDVFGENGALAQGDYLAAALQAATLIKNAGQITDQQLNAEGYSMLGAAVGIAVSSRNGEIAQNLENNFGNSIGVYTNQYSKNNLEDIPTNPVEFDAAAALKRQEARDAAEYAQELADTKAKQAQQQEELAQRTNAELDALTEQKNAIGTQISNNLKVAEKALNTINEWNEKIVDPTDTNLLYSSPVYIAARALGDSESVALGKAFNDAVSANQGAQAIIESANRQKESVYAINKLLVANQESLTQQAQLIKDYGPDYAAKISRDSLDYIQKYGAVVAQENTLDTSALPNPFLDHEIATKTYLAALNSGRISSVSQAAADLQTSENLVKVERQAAVSQAIGKITENYGNLTLDKSQTNVEIAVLLAEQSRIDGERTELTDRYRAWQVDQTLGNIVEDAKYVGLKNIADIEKLVIERALFQKTTSNSFTEKKLLQAEYADKVGAYPDSDSAKEFLLGLAKKYDPTNPDAGLITKQDFIDKYSGASYIDPENGNTYKWTESQAVLKYYAALEKAPALYEKAIASFDIDISKVVTRQIVLNSLELSNIKGQIGDAYVTLLKSKSATGDEYTNLTTSIENKIIDLGKTQEKITASELLSQRMVIVNTELASAQAVVVKELAYNKNPDKPYVVMVDTRSAEQIQSDSKPAATSESKSSMAKTTISMEVSVQQAILALQQKLGTTNIYGLTIEKQETFDDYGRRIYSATAKGVAVPIPTDLVTTVRVTYKNEFGDIVTDNRYYSGSTYLSQSQAAAATLAEFKSIKNTKVLGLAVGTGNNNSSTNTNGKRLNANNS
jgi:hypothetical protein